MLMVIDCESTGLPDDKLPAWHDSQPRATQVAWTTFDETMTEVNSVSTLVNTGTYPSKGAVALNGLTEDRLFRHGVPPIAMLHMLKCHLDTVRCVVAWNLPFDWGLIERECRTLGQDTGWMRRPRLKRICLMQLVTDLYATEKWLKLAVGYQRVTGNVYTATHLARDDCDAAAEIAANLIARGKLEP